MTGEDPIEPLAALVEASLVRRRGERFTLLETMREYALDQLDDAATRRRRRHLVHYLAVAETAWDGILVGGEPEREGMAVQEREADNLRAAFAFAVSTGDDDAVVASCVRAALVRGSCAVDSSKARAAFDEAVTADVEPLCTQRR